MIAQAGQGAAEGTAILARQQTKGRGSRGRGWLAPAGNLNLSVLFRPVGPLDPAAWSLLAGVALFDALRQCAPHAPLELKWPNDVLLDRRKLAGLLIEAAAAGPDRDAWLVAGFGVNLRHRPADLDRPSACLAEVGVIVDPQSLAERLLERLWTWRQSSPAMISAAWLARAHPIGTILRITPGEISGRFAGLAPDGALLLQLADGSQRRFHSGELVFPTA